MRRRDYWLMLLLVTASGFVGGSVTSWLLTNEVAHATDRNQLKVVKAQAFYLVDEEGNIRANLSFSSVRKGGGRMGVIRADGTWEFPQGVGIEILTKDGRVIWSAPVEGERK